MCYNYNEIKHISRFYKKPWKKWNNPTKEGDKNIVHISTLDANLATGGNDTNEEVLGDKVFQDFEDTLVVLSVEVDRHDWFTNFSASKHVTRIKYCFSFLGKAKGPINIRSTNGQSHPIKGKRECIIQIQFQGIKITKWCFYILGMKKNLLSMGSIVDQGKHSDIWFLEVFHLIFEQS
jgi:hypothetical protein